MTQEQKAALEAAYPDCTVLAAQPNSDATRVVGEVTDEVAVEYTNGTHGTLYVTWDYDDGTPTLQWDVSGWPHWYDGERT